MERLRYSLIADGMSDRALMPVLRWLLVKRYPLRLPLEASFADLRYLPRPASGLAARLGAALHLYPCDLLFVHRDAEGEAASVREEEILNALGQLDDGTRPPAVCVIPIRMQEAWMLFDEQAIRMAANNPNGRQSLELPPISTIESLPDPKKILYGLLRKASGRSKRRLRKFRVPAKAVQVGQYVDDFEPLLELPAFQRLVDDLRGTLAEMGCLDPSRC